MSQPPGQPVCLRVCTTAPVPEYVVLCAPHYFVSLISLCYTLLAVLVRRFPHSLPVPRHMSNACASLPVFLISSVLIQLQMLGLPATNSCALRLHLLATHLSLGAANLVVRHCHSFNTAPLHKHADHVPSLSSEQCFYRAGAGDSPVLLSTCSSPFTR